MSEKSKAELLLSKHLEELGIQFVTEFKFHPKRKWRWDFVLNPGETRLAVEIDGYFKGRHGAGWGADNEKRNTGTMMGYRVLVFSTKDVYNGTAKKFLEEAFNGER